VAPKERVKRRERADSSRESSQVARCAKSLQSGRARSCTLEPVGFRPPSVCHYRRDFMASSLGDNSSSLLLPLWPDLFRHSVPIATLCAPLWTFGAEVAKKPCVLFEHAAKDKYKRANAVDLHVAIVDI